MAISMTKLSSADYYLDRTREALQADGAIPDEATPGPLTGPDPAAYYNAEGNPPGRWIGSASRLLGGETGRQAGAETVRMLINERRNPETGRSLDQAGIRADNDGQPPIAGYDLTPAGQWTALDGRAVDGATVEQRASNATLVKDLLTQRLGWAWHEPARARGRGTRAVAGEVQGVPEELIDAFSGRDREIETRLAAIIDEDERRTGHTIGW